MMHTCQIDGCENQWSHSENWSGRYQCDKHLKEESDE